jgi:hypothetical protein
MKNKGVLSACKKSLKHHKSFYDAKKHKNFDHKEHDSIMRKIRCAEVIMEYARRKQIEAVRVAGVANRNAKKHLKTHNHLEKRATKADQDRERRNKAGRRACFTKARNTMKTRRTSLYRWYRKNYAQCRKHDHKKFKTHICDSWLNLRRVREISLKRQHTESRHQCVVKYPHA